MNKILDKIILAADDFLFTCFAHTQNTPLPTQENNHQPTEKTAREHTAGLMRINHVGEVCAQGLYGGAKFFAQSDTTYQFLHQAQKDELTHLSWCNIRLSQLNGRPSYLIPFYYAASFAMGAGAGVISDPFSLGFVVETEKQVEEHLKTHIQDLSPSDTMTHETLKKMQEDESGHAEHAIHLGAYPLSPLIKTLMRQCANLMKKISYHL